MEERRRAPRVVGRFWIEVEGVDSDPQLVRGDISTTGICFERAEGVGEIGIVEKLAIASQDGAIQVRLLAQYVRSSTSVDKDSGVRQPMVAFQFLPDTGELVAKLRKLVQHVVQERTADKSLVIDHRFGVDLKGKSGTQAATVFRLEVSRMRVQASWPIAVGDKVQVVFQSFAGGERIPFEGIATRVGKLPTGGYEAEVELAVAGVRTAFPVSSGTAHNSITDSIDIMFDTGDVERGSTPLPKVKHDLSGKLERIPFTALLSLFEIERMSGELRLRSDDQAYTLFWSNGVLLDIEPNDATSTRGALSKLMKWTKGTFRFLRKDVEREDRVKAPISALLLDLAREADEESR